MKPEPLNLYEIYQLIDNLEKKKQKRGHDRFLGSYRKVDDK